ncbi:MAG: MFS transporter [Deltaproteobacteria bacterium]
MSKKLFWLYALSSSVYFTQGIEGLPSQGLFYYFKETLGFSPEKIMLISSVTISAWLVKPFIGYAIDRFWNKKIWIAFSLVADIALVAMLGVIAFPVVILIAMLVLNASDAAVRDVAVDGIMCTEGKRHNITGKIQSVQWISISVSGLLTGIGGGIIAEKWGYRMGFLWLIPVYLVVLLTTYLYRPTNEPADGKSTISLAELKKVLTNKQLLIIGLFIFLYKYSPSFGTPLFFVQRDSFKWGKVWIGVLGTISTVCSIAGALLYYRMSQRINMKKWLWWSVFLGAATTVSYLYYTPVTAVAYDVIYGLMGMFIFLMVMDFMVRNTVAGFEATSFALLCSISNLALVASNLSGAFLLPKVGLSWLIILSALTSFLCLPLIKKIKA